MSVKDNAKNVDTWLRGLFILIFGLIFYFLYILIWLLVIFQFFTKVVTGNLNENLCNFSESLTRFAFQILLYITFQSEERPFPFSPWPEHDRDTNGDLSTSADKEQFGRMTQQQDGKEDDSKSA